ncbi:latent-transforming growth factor beta-binding protein 2-like, partial [Rhincodon typus]|uniref:latent-transforming growth factor beta-binding protein 2-like n=1 Tax=Rhincodon typus TaxID=259920 RepID=UPI00202F6D46
MWKGQGCGSLVLALVWLMLAVCGRAREPSAAHNRRLAPGRGNQRALPLSLNVCGSGCCNGWALGPQTRQCTKPICFPRCQNGGFCQQPQTCFCKPGFTGTRCEIVTDLQLPTNPTTVSPKAQPVPVLSMGRISKKQKRERAGGKKASSTRYIGRKKSTVRWQPLT